MRKEIMLFFLAFLLVKAFSSNLICNGDFQGKYPTLPYLDSYYIIYPSNPSCWYDLKMSNIEIKRFTNVQLSDGADMTTTMPINLCQTVNLQIGKKYVLSYDMYCQNGLYDMIWLIKLNNIVIGTQYIADEGSLNSGKGTQIFTSSKVENQICFSETHKRKSLTYTLVGGFIDNITLQAYEEEIYNSNTASNISENTIANISENTTVQVNQLTYNSQTITEQIQQEPQKFTIYINFEVDCYEKFGEIYLISNQSDKGLVHALQNDNIQIFLNNEEQQIKQISLNSQGFIVIIFKPTRSLVIQNNLDVKIKDLDLLKKFINFQIYLNNRKVNFQKLTQSQQKMISQIENTAKQLLEVSHTVYLIFSGSLATYFLMSLFSFWNLSLMYIFLNLQSVPSFLRKMYQIIIQMMYVEGSLLSWVLQILNIPQKNIKIDFEDDVPENMPIQLDGYSWFGIFGMSSKVFENNMENFVNIGFLFIKLLTAKLIGKCLSKKLKKALNIQIGFCQIFFCQVIAFSPFFILSAGTIIVHSSINYIDKCEKACQIMIFWVCILLIPIYAVLKADLITNSVKNKIQKQKIELKYVLKIAKKQMQAAQDFYYKNLDEVKQKAKQLQASLLHEFYEGELLEAKLDILEISVNITIPLCILIQVTQLFLVLNGILILLRLRFYCKLWKIMTIKDKLFRLIMNVVWIAHHSAFTTFYFMQKIAEQNNNDYSEQQNKILLYTSIIAMISIITGGFMQMLVLLINCLAFILNVIKRVYKAYCQNNQISDIQISKNEKINQQAIQKDKIHQPQNKQNMCNDNKERVQEMIKDKSDNKQKCQQQQRQQDKHPNKKQPKRIKKTKY